MRLARLTLILALLAPASAAEGGEAVRISPGQFGLAVLERPPQPRASIILVPGGDGIIGVQPNGGVAHANNQLVRTRSAYASHGLATLVVDGDVNLGVAVRYMRRIAEPVTVAGTSRGTLRAAQLVASAGGPSRPDAIVLTSGFYMPDRGPSVQGIVGSPARLPPTLVVHNRHDRCRFTLPQGVEEFQRWAGARARVAWIDSRGGGGDPCRPFSPHGFYGADAQVVSTIARFALSVR